MITTGCGGGDSAGGGREIGAPQAGSGGSGGSSGEGGGASGQGGTSGFGNPSGDPVAFDAGVVDARVVDPDVDDCGGTAVEPTVMMETIPGNILLVFDMSGSMDDEYPGAGQPKWIVARDAVLNAITPLQDSINVGVLFFPLAGACGGDDRNDCCVPPFGTSPQIDFLPGPDFIASWNTFWGGTTGVRGSTPTLEALQAAGVALTNAAATLSGTTTVVLITDGDPKCGADLPDLGLFPTPDQINMAVAAQVAQLIPFPTDWLAQGISTHVLGLPGPSANALPVLDGIAAAGGTVQHISPTDPTALQMELAKIVGESVSTSFDSCSIGLPSEPPDVNDVALVVVEGGVEQAVDRDLGAGGGWALMGAGADMSIILQGELCNQARAGAYDKISVVFGCVDLPPLPPPDPPE